MEINRKMNGIKKKNESSCCKMFCVHNYRRPIWPHSVPSKKIWMLLILIKWAVMTHLILLHNFFSFFCNRVFVWGWEKVLRRAEIEKKRKSCWQPQQQQKNPIGMWHSSLLQLGTSWFTVNPARCQDLLRSGGGSKCIFYICSRSKKKKKKFCCYSPGKLFDFEVAWLEGNAFRISVGQPRRKLH